MYSNCDDFMYIDEYKIYTLVENEFILPERLDNTTVFDFTGSQYLKCLDRNVKNIVSIARNGCVADKKNIDERLSLSKYFLCELVEDIQVQKKYIDLYGRADYVLIDIDKSILSFDKFIFFLSEVTKEVLIIRSEFGQFSKEISLCTLSNGFRNVSEVNTSMRLGRGKFCYYIIDKRKLISCRGIETYKGNLKIYRKAYNLMKKIKIYYFHKINSIFEDKNISRYYSKTFFHENKYIREFASYSQWCKIKNLYEKIKHIPFVQECDFSFFKKLVSPSYDNNLLTAKFNDCQKNLMKKQVVSLLILLNKAGVAHRDFHLGNLFYHDGKIVLTDLEFLEEDNRPLISSYDVTGIGLESPLKSGNMHIFIDHPYSVAKFLGIKIDDLFNPPVD